MENITSVGRFFKSEISILEEKLRRSEARAIKAEKRLEALELVAICANDIVTAWPKLTLRMLSSMTSRIDTLRQALDDVRSSQ